MTTEVYECSLTIIELKDFAKSKGLGGLSKMKKNELVKKICESYSDELKAHENDVKRTKSVSKTDKPKSRSKKETSKDEKKSDEKEVETEKKPPKITLKTFNSILNKKHLWLSHVGSLDKGVYTCELCSAQICQFDMKLKVKDIASTVNLDNILLVCLKCSKTKAKSANSRKTKSESKNKNNNLVINQIVKGSLSKDALKELNMNEDISNHLQKEKTPDIKIDETNDIKLDSLLVRDDINIDLEIENLGKTINAQDNKANVDENVDAQKDDEDEEDDEENEDEEDDEENEDEDDDEEEEDD